MISLLNYIKTRELVMSKISDVIGFELRRNLKKKTFWYTTLILPIIIIAVFAITNASSNNASNNTLQQTSSYSKTAKLAVLDETGLLNKQKLMANHIIIEPDKQSGINGVKDGKITAFFYYPKDVEKAGIQVYAQDQGITFTPPYNTLATQLLSQSAIATVSLSSHDSQVVQILLKSPSVTATTYKNGVETNGLASIVAPIIFFAIFMFFAIMISYFAIAATTEEKENRAAEILLTTIKSRSLILGKILSILILGVVQIAIIVVPLVIAYAIFHNHVRLPGGVSLSHIPLNAKAIVIGASVLLMGIVMFTSILVGFGSMFPSAQDASRYLAPVMLCVFIPLYAIGYVVSSPHALIVNVFTYFPLTAPSTVMLRNAVGTLSTGETIATMTILLISVILSIFFAIRAFSHGAMAYSRRVSLKELFN
jgi:ABC-2 type transport system permease protein